MLLRRIGVLAFVLFVGFGWFAHAFAGSGKANDPANDVMDSETNERGEGKLDIIANAHSDDGVRVTYVLTTTGPFEPRDSFLINWALYDLEGIREWDCAPVSVGVRVQAGAFDGKVERCNGSGGGGSGGPGGQQVLADAEVVHARGSNKIQVSYPIDALRRAGFTGTTIRYRAFTRDAGGNSDMLPDTDPPITHELSLPPTAAPETAKPTVAVAVTPVPTLLPTIEPTPPTVTDEASSFSAPESRDDAGAAASAPLKAAATGSVVIAAAGAAFLTFRPL